MLWFAIFMNTATPHSPHQNTPPQPINTLFVFSSSTIILVFSLTVCFIWISEFSVFLFISLSLFFSLLLSDTPSVARLQVLIKLPLLARTYHILFHQPCHSTPLHSFSPRGMVWTRPGSPFRLPTPFYIRDAHSSSIITLIPALRPVPIHQASPSKAQTLIRGIYCSPSILP